MAPRLLQLCAVDFTARHFLMPLMHAQRAAGFDVHLACAAGEYVEGIRAEGFTVHPIGFERSLNLLAHRRAYGQLRRLLRRVTFEVVHAHTPVAAMIARPAARRSGVPLVLYTAHGFYFHEAMKPPVRRAHIWLERWAQRHADYLFTQSSEDAETAVAEKISTAERTLAIGNGVDTARFDPARHDPQTLATKRADLGLAEGDGPVIVMIGRLVREKGYFELLEALGRLRGRFPRLRAVAVGAALASDHDDRAREIRAAAARLELAETLIFAGMRPDVPELLALGDIYCLPSWREGMPRSIIEAMAAGLPVVATDIRGCREEVVPERTGLLVPVRDAEALAEALGRLAGDPELRRSMGRAGQARARELYDEARVIERQMQTMRTLYAQRGLEWPAG